MKDKLILGTVQFGLDYGINNSVGKVPIDESQKILCKAFQEGIRVIDTAEVYGNAHQVIGDFHRANPDMKFSIITKVSPSDNLSSVEDKINQYLVELNVNILEGFMFHSFQSYLDHKVILPKLLKLKDNGLIKHLGVSVYTNNEFEALIKDDGIDLIQLPFNLLDNYFLRGELMLEAKRKGKTIHTRSAFLQGLFFKNPIDKLPIVQALQPQLLKIHEIAKECEVSVASLALNYCLQQSNIDYVLIGVDSLKQLEVNLNALNFKIDKKIINIINQIYTEDTDLLNPSLWDKEVF